VANWQAEPRRLSGTWACYRQTAVDTAPLFHAAGEAQPSQRSGRWHREGEGYAQYLSLDASGAWCELIRYEAIRADARAEQYRRNLWLVSVTEDEIADLSSFDDWEQCGLDPRMAVAEHEACQELAVDLLDAGYRGVLSPCAALSGATNLTLFGTRYERVLRSSSEHWENPAPGVMLACTLIAEAGPPIRLVTETCGVGMVHEGYREYLRERGLPVPGPQETP
jgi:RES domain